MQKLRKYVPLLCLILIQLNPAFTIYKERIDLLGGAIDQATIPSIQTSVELQKNIFESTEMRLTNSAYYSENPRIKIDTRGNIHIVWQDGKASPVNPTDYTLTYGIYYKKFDGTNWSEDLNLSEEPTASYPVLDIDSHNRIHVIWQDSRAGDTVDLFYKTYNEAGWSANQQITHGKGILPGSGLAERPTLTVDHQNQLHCAWGDNRISMNNYEIFYKTFSDGSWSDDQRLTNVWGKSKNPSITVDNQNNLHLVYEDDREGNKELYYKTRTNSGMWSEDERLTNAEKASILPVIVADSQDNLHVLWIDQRNGNWEVFYKIRTKAGWGPDQRLTAGNFARSLAATVDARDNLHVVYYDARQGTHAIYYLMKSKVGWSSERPLVAERSTKMRNPTIITDSDGNLHMTWCDERDGMEKSEIYYKAGFPLLITVSNPVIVPGSVSNTIDITDVIALSSHPEQGELDASEVASAYFEIYDVKSNPTGIVGNLTWSEQEWQAREVNISSLPEGDYSVIVFFRAQNAFGTSHKLIGPGSFRLPVITIAEFQLQELGFLIPLVGVLGLITLTLVRPHRAFKGWLFSR
ncbi:MAG: hypothetical protein ACE5R6_20605 [Candidatus Heimdallarchaeota archaeon]